MSPARFLLFPWWVLRLATGAKSFRDNPVIGSRRLNVRGLHAKRITIAHRLAARRRLRLAPLISPADRETFDRDGFIAKRNFLPADQFDQLRDQLLAYRGPAREMVQGDTITRRYAVDGTMRRAIPELTHVLDNATWRGLVRYAGSFDQEPLIYLQSILSHVRDAPPDPQTHFHADTFHPTVKAWLFLTDVAEDEGPFCYVPGSHRLTAARLAWEKAMSIKAPDGVDRLSARGSFRITREELPGLGLPEPKAFAVPANTLVVGDTFGFHARGPSAHESVRVELWAYGRRNPFLPWTGLDPLSTPGVAPLRIPYMWGFRDRWKRFVGQPWRAAGDKLPTER